MNTGEITVQKTGFTADQELEQLYGLVADRAKIGAIATFTGLVRDLNEGDEVTSLFLEHYPGMTETVLQAIVNEARDRWSLLGVRLVHRIGLLMPGDPVVMVSVAAMHRKNAFLACDFLMDYLKTRAPFWKKETTRGSSHWVASRQSDISAAAAWSNHEDNR